MSARENPVSARVYDDSRGTLVYIGTRADPELWDSLWSLDAATIERALAPDRDGDRIVALTSRYLRPGDGIILEGGCGKGQFVAAFQRAGYQAIGLDYAPATVQALNEHAPELDIRLGDLRNIPLADGSVAGYWSIGVIEHFWDGYDPLMKEMARVLRPGGFLFCSFPFMNRLRSFKARLGLYRGARFSREPDDFYQFALRQEDVVAALKENGFSLVAAHRSSGLKGILGELGAVDAPLQKLYGYEGTSVIVRGVRMACDLTLSRLGTPHSILLVLRRDGAA